MRNFIVLSARVFFVSCRVTGSGSVAESGGGFGSLGKCSGGQWRELGMGEGGF